MAIPPNLGPQVQQIAEQMMKRMKFYAECSQCKEEAFCYAKKPEKGRLLVGALIYHRGYKPRTYTDEQIKKGKLKCVKCNLRITDDAKITLAAERFTVKSIMRFIEVLGNFVKAMNKLTQEHIPMLEYCHILGMDYDGWKKIQDMYETNLEHISKQAKMYYAKCVVVGECGEPMSPSEIFKAKAAKSDQQVAAEIAEIQKKMG